MTRQSDATKPLALITGGSAGIGAMFARRLVERGYDLILVARDEQRLAGFAKELESRCRCQVEILKADLSIDADLQRVERRISELPRLDLLVNNAGYGFRGTFLDTSVKAHEDMIKVHVLAAVRLMHAALATMVERGEGGIINVSSVGARMMVPTNETYGATKAFLLFFSQSLAPLLAAKGIKIQALCPGFTHTEFHDRAHMSKKVFPSWGWLSAEQVVDESLAALDRGVVVCTPSFLYKCIMVLLRFMPDFGFRLMGRSVPTR
jgi:short-subunit dehydrogenase